MEVVKKMSKKHRTNIITVSGCHYLLIPDKIKNDSSFPFKLDCKNLLLEIKGNKLIIVEQKEDKK